MATSIFGVPYADIIAVLSPPGFEIYGNVDAGTFADDGSDPPKSYTYTANTGAWVVGGQYSSIIGVVAKPPA